MCLSLVQAVLTSNLEHCSSSVKSVSTLYTVERWYLLVLISCISWNSYSRYTHVIIQAALLPTLQCRRHRYIAKPVKLSLKHGQNYRAYSVTVKGITNV
ncbi:hypothetical protein RIF29_29433 [Crotalaria pallida]|uniref:Uncharacterized protein n=1 Tax=Crotalaria pallida TaxID=3830 RepID=A0AAN9EF02_CROPI